MRGAWTDHKIRKSYGEWKGDFFDDDYNDDDDDDDEVLQSI